MRFARFEFSRKFPRILILPCVLQTVFFLKACFLQGILLQTQFQSTPVCFLVQFARFFVGLNFAFKCFLPCFLAPLLASFLASFLVSLLPSLFPCFSPCLLHCFIASSLVSLLPPRPASLFRTLLLWSLPSLSFLPWFCITFQHTSSQNPSKRCKHTAQCFHSMGQNRSLFDGLPPALLFNRMSSVCMICEPTSQQLARLLKCASSPVAYNATSFLPSFAHSDKPAKVNWNMYSFSVTELTVPSYEGIS